MKTADSASLFAALRSIIPNIPADLVQRVKIELSADCVPLMTITQYVSGLDGRPVINVDADGFAIETKRFKIVSEDAD